VQEEHVQEEHVQEEHVQEDVNARRSERGLGFERGSFHRLIIEGRPLRVLGME
jgi:hypothetical protein